MDDTPVWIVIAYRCGRGWSFPIGVFSTEYQAKESAADHRRVRGGKYDHRIFPVVVGQDERHSGMGIAGKPCIEWADGVVPATDEECADFTRQHLAEAVQAASKRVKELEEKVAGFERREAFGVGSWVSVTEGLPAFREDVLVHVPHVGEAVSHRESIPWSEYRATRGLPPHWAWMDSNGTSLDPPPTHWMRYLPKGEEPHRFPFWVSWRHPEGSPPFELSSPWWVSGSGPGYENICAALMAFDCFDAEVVVRRAYWLLSSPDRPPEISFRFIEQKPTGWSPFNERFPRESWMVWPEGDGL